MFNFKLYFAICPSARILGRKRKTITEDTTERIENFNRKRKAEDDVAETLCKKAKVTLQEVLNVL